MASPHATRLALAIAAAVCLSTPALAQTAVDMVNSIPEAFRDTVRQMEAPLATIGLGLLGGLVVIELAFALGIKWMEGAGLHEILGTIVKHGLMIGLFAWLVRFGPDACRGILLWMTQAGNTAAGAMGGGVNLSPGDVVAIGFNMIAFVFREMSATSPLKSLVLFASGMILVWAFAEMTAAIVMVTIKGYFFAAWAALMMGFGGSAYTRDIAIGQLRLALAIGAERFVLTCIIGVGEGLMRLWGTQMRAVDFHVVSVIPMMICPWIMVRLVSTLPAYAHSLISGHQHGVSYGSPIRQAAGSMVSAAGVAAAGTAGMGAAIAAAYDKASAQMEAPAAGGGAGGGGAGGGGGSTSSGSIGSAIKTSALAASNLGKAAVADVGKRMRGDFAANNGHLGFRMAAALSSQAEGIRNPASTNRGTRA